jgi:hypothetical protein
MNTTTFDPFVVGLGARQAFDCFVAQLISGTGLGLASLSLAFALAQLALHMAQPLLAQLAEGAGEHRAALAAAVLLGLVPLLPAVSAAGATLFLFVL